MSAAFDRTYEGLKLLALTSMASHRLPFDRTYEGLKLPPHALAWARKGSFDRTYEGLKQRGGHDAGSLLLQLLTVPMRV